MPPKKFIFKLQSVLELKYKKEDEEKEKLAKLYALQAQEQQKLEMLLHKEMMTRQELKEKQKEGGIDVDELKRFQFFLKRLAGEIESQKLRLQEIAIRIENQRQALLKAAQERQIFEKLKEKRMEEFNLEVEEEERKLIDELGTIRFSRQQREDGF